MADAIERLTLELSKVVFFIILFSGQFFFHHLKIIPTVIQDKTCVIRSKIPISELLNNVIPTVPSIKRGEELFAKAINLSLSISLKTPLSFKSETIIAPIGQPSNYSHNKWKQTFFRKIKDRFHKSIQFISKHFKQIYGNKQLSCNQKREKSRNNRIYP